MLLPWNKFELPQLGYSFSANLHQKGEVHFTKDKLPIELVHLSLFPDKKRACDFERYLKSGSGAAFRNKRWL
jgi:putative endonuclease